MIVKADSAEEAIAELKQLGALHPFDPLKGKPPMAILPYHCGRIFPVNGVMVWMQITLNMIGHRKFWHMSCSQFVSENDEPAALPDEITDHIRRLMFRDNGEWFEMPSAMWPGRVRQFMQEKT